MAKMLEPRIGKLDTFKSFNIACIICWVPIGLVFLQPDLGYISCVKRRTKTHKRHRQLSCHGIRTVQHPPD